MTGKRRVLGRGLSALIPGAAGAPAGMPPAGGSKAGAFGPAGVPAAVVIRGAQGLDGDARDGLREVAIEDVHPARAQPRKNFDEGRLEELAASIRAQGVIQPLVVRARDQGGYEIIAGERRWRGAQRAGLHTVPVVVRDIAPARAFELAMVENLQREDLNPIEEAEGFDRMIREFGYTQESLAARVGKERTTVTNSLRLLKLPAGVRSLVISGRLSMGHARAILGLESLSAAAPAGNAGETTAEVSARMERLGRAAATRDMSVRQVEALVRREKNPAAGPGPAAEITRPSASARDLETRLARALGTRVHVQEKPGGRGHIEIHFGSLDQLDGLLRKLLP